MLSAFGAAHSAIHASGLKAIAAEGPLLPTPAALLKRVASVGVTYLVSFLLSWFLRCLTMRHCANGNTCYRPAQIVLEGVGLFGWLPAEPFVRQSYNQPAWFVSALAFCWLFERAFIRLACLAQLRLARAPGRLPWPAILGVAVYILTAPTAACPFTWGDSRFATHAVQALHPYFCGTLLAAHLHARADAGLPPYRCAATLAALVLLGLFCVRAPSGQGPGPVPGYLEAWHAKGLPDIRQLRQSGGALPIFASLLAGLAGNVDPLARLLHALPPPGHEAARDLSGAMYLLQRPVGLGVQLALSRGQMELCGASREAWPFAGCQYLGGPAQLGALFAALVPVAALVHYGLQRPVAALVARHLPK